MSVFDGKRLPISTFKLDVERMRRGWYSDKYFYNIVAVLSDLARQGYRFGGSAPDLSDLVAGNFSVFVSIQLVKSFGRAFPLIA